jgi:hemin uptake protein HemP
MERKKQINAPSRRYIELSLMELPFAVIIKENGRRYKLVGTKEGKVRLDKMR